MESVFKYKESGDNGEVDLKVAFSKLKDIRFIKEFMTIVYKYDLINKNENGQIPYYVGLPGPELNIPKKVIDEKLCR